METVLGTGLPMLLVYTRVQQGKSKICGSTWVSVGTELRPLSFICPNGFDLAFLQVLFSPVLDLNENVGHLVSSG